MREKAAGGLREQRDELPSGSPVCYQLVQECVFRQSTSQEHAVVVYAPPKVADLFRRSYGFGVAAKAS
jgi:hypothetical protein